MSSAPRSCPTSSAGACAPWPRGPATAAPLHADDYQLITPNGSALTKHDYLDAVRRAPALPHLRTSLRHDGPR